MQTDLMLDFADGKYAFKLSVEGILELQEKTKAGFGSMFGRVCAGLYRPEDDGSITGWPLDAQFHLSDLLETIRLALIGGGAEPLDALKLVQRYCYPAQPLKGTWELAGAILLASMEGFKVKDSTVEEPVKKKTTRTRTRKARSTPEQSTQT